MLKGMLTDPRLPVNHRIGIFFQFRSVFHQRQNHAIDVVFRRERRNVAVQFPRFVQLGERARFERRRRARNWAILAVLVAMVVLFYFVSTVRMFRG